MEPVSSAYAPQRLVTVQDWGEIDGLAQRARLSELAVTVRDPVPGPIRIPDITIPSRAAETATLLRTGPVGSDIASSGGGWIALTQPFDPAWRLNGNTPLAQLGVTDLFEAPSTPGLAELRYSRWPLVRLGYTLSAAFILMALLVAVGARRGRSRRATSGAN